MGDFVDRCRKDDGGIIAGLLVLILAGAVAYGGFLAYKYWDENQDTTPAPAAVPPGAEELSGKGVTLVIPKGWSQEKVSSKELERRFQAFVGANPEAADKSGLDLIVDPESSVAFLAIEDNKSKGRQDLNVAVTGSGDTDLASIQSALTVQLERSGATKLKWQTTTLGGVDARQLDLQRKFGTVVVYQRQYYVLGDKVGATLTFSSLKPIDDAEADAVADTMRVD